MDLPDTQGWIYTNSGFRYRWIAYSDGRNEIEAQKYVKGVWRDLTYGQFVEELQRKADELIRQAERLKNA